MNKIKELREKAGLSQQQLADMVRSSQPQIQRLEKSKRTLSKKWAELLAPPLRTSPQQLLFETVEEEPLTKYTEIVRKNVTQDLPNASISDKIEAEARLIPLYGQAVGGVDGEFVMNEKPLDYVPAHPSVANAKDAYAVTVSGDSMSPRYEDGETCYVDPRVRVTRGDYVVVQIQFEDSAVPLAYVKRFIKRNDQELVLEQINPQKELRFEGRFVVSVHYIRSSETRAKF